MRLLWYLIQHRDRLVPARELLECVWPGVHVTDLALAGAIRVLRKALGDASHTLILTRRGHGYRFAADVQEVGMEASQTRESGGAPELGEPRLLGRDAELATLESALGECARGRGQVVLVRGVVGIGKTALADHLKRRARQRGLGVHASGWHARGGASPWAPWIQLLSGCLPTADLERDLSWLRSPGPASGASQPDAARASARGEAAAREAVPARGAFEISQRLVDLLGQAARARPRVIVLEDLHEADPDSLVVLELVAGWLADLPILLLTTLREETVPPSPALRRARVGLRRAPGYSEHHLAGLDLDSVRSLIASRSADPPPESFVARVHERTRGNPLFVTELARLRASGQLRAAERGGMALPEAVRDALELQIAQHRPSCQRALRVAAVVGSEFEVELLRGLLGAPRDEVLDILSEAEAGGLVREAEGRPGTYTFQHPLMREVLYEGLPRADARRWHLRTAEALEARYARDLSPYLSDLAYHFSEAAPVGGAERAINYARQAAEQSHRMWAFCDAAEQYGRALQALELLADPDPDLRSELCTAYGRELQISSLREDRSDDARAALEAGVRIAAQARSPERWAAALVDQVRVELEPLLIRARSIRAPAPTLGRLRAQLTEALEALPRGAGAARGRLLVCMAYVHFFLDELPAQRRCLQEAEAATMGHPELLEELLTARWWFAQAPDALLERRQLSERLCALTGRSRWLVFALAEGGELSAADKLMDAAHQRAAGGSGDVDVWLWRTMRATISGRFDDAERLLEKIDGLDSFMARMARGVQHIWLRRVQGRAAEVLPAPQEKESPFSRVFWALLYAEAGRIEQARQELRASELERMAEALPLNQAWLFTLALAADVLQQTGESTQAKALYDKLLPFEGRMIASMWALLFVGSVDRPLGLLAACQGCWDTALKHLEHALRAHERIQAPALVAQSQLDLASTLWRRGRPGDPRRAKNLAHAAAALASGLGMTRVAEQARQLTETQAGPT